MAKKKKPAEYYFGKFLNTLREEEAEIKIYGNTYSSKNKNLTVKSLVQEICGFDSDYKIDTVLREGRLIDENSRKMKTSKKQKNVINELEFFFKNDSVPHSNSNSNTPDQREDNAFSFPIIENLRSNLYMRGEGYITDVYPELANSITNDVLTNLRKLSVEEIYRLLFFSISEDDPFSELTIKLFPEVNSTHNTKGINLEFKKINRPGSLEEFANEYEIAIKEYEKTTTKPFVELMSHFKLGHIPYDLKKTKKNLSSIPLYENFKDKKKWFDRYRYNRLLQIEELLNNLCVEEWPKWTIEHLILIQLEYIFLKDEIIKAIESELTNNIGFTLFTSSNGATIDMQKDYKNLEALSNELTLYKFPGGINKNIQLANDNIFIGNYYRLPNDLIARGQESIFNIFFEILDGLIDHLVLQVSKRIDLNERMRRRIAGSILDDYIKARRERVEN